MATQQRHELRKCTSAALLSFCRLADHLTKIPSRPNGVGERPRHYPHHSLYVVLLAEDVLTKSRVLRVNPDRENHWPCVYLGVTGHSPEVRFYNHKRGHKSSQWVRDYGIRLWPEMTDSGPMPYQVAVHEEGNLAAALRAEGWTVLAGHHDSH